MQKLKDQTEANFNNIFAFCKKRDVKSLQELDNREYSQVKRKIADLTVTTSVKSLVGYYLPDFQSVTSNETNPKYLNNSAQYEAEFSFISKFEPGEQIVLQKVRYEQQLHSLK